MIGSFLSDDEVEALQTSALSRDAPYLVTGVSRSQFSLARHYGGIRYNGQHYTYIPPTDELIRADVLKWVKARRRATLRAGNARQTTLGF